MTFMDIVLGKEEESVGEKERFIVVSGERCFCRAPTSSSRVRTECEKPLTFLGLQIRLTYRLSRRRQNSTEVRSGTLPAMYRIEYSFPVLPCREVVPECALEHRTEKRKAEHQAGVTELQKNAKSPKNYQEGGHPDLPRLVTGQ